MLNTANFPTIVKLQFSAAFLKRVVIALKLFGMKWLFSALTLLEVELPGLLLLEGLTLLEGLPGLLPLEMGLLLLPAEGL